MNQLVPVHGGLDKPVSQIIPLNKRKQFLADCSSLPAINVVKADVSLIYRFSDGTLSPMVGPMKREVFNAVLEKETISVEGTDYAWTIPLSLPLTDKEASSIKAGGSAVLLNDQGVIFGILKNCEVFDFDKPKYISSVYLTERIDHPGADQVMNDERTKLVGGEVWTLDQAIDEAYASNVYSPTQTRVMIAQNQWEKAIAFQTRNPLHRAHEYALVAGVEELTRQGFYCGVVLNPLIGELKGDDVPAKTRMKCYQKLVNEKLLGQGDKDEALWDTTGYGLHEIFKLVGLDMKMFYGGPKEAVMHAIYRQNHGFSNIVIGRKHADAPYADGTAIWGDFDAHKIFDNLKGDLQIKPIKIGFAAYYESIKRVDLMDKHSEEKALFISGSSIRNSLKSGKIPDERVIRPQISEILIDYYASQA